jgi:hypothetical protein
MVMLAALLNGSYVRYSFTWCSKYVSLRSWCKVPKSILEISLE